jgi:N-acetyl-alpha-D-muramate 1-phosphate uridylyltransferase
MLDTAMILAAGRGERMRPLTDHRPKPLLDVGGKALIVWHLERLAKAGFKRVVVNHAWLGQQIESALGDGEQWGLTIVYSPEPEALETAGGIARALPLLGAKPFLVVNGDIFCAFDLGRAHSIALQLGLNSSASNHALRAWCVMVPNAEHHPKGDFALEHGLLVNPQPERGLGGLTFSGIAVYQPSFFDAVPRGAKMPLRPLLESGIARQSLAAEFYDGLWLDIGTPERLSDLNRLLQAQSGQG